jgi:orotidine-5'-phosphate decarboxylase
MRAFEEVVRHAKKKGLIVIEDAKRGDIGSTAEAYADGHLGEVELLDGRHSPSLDVDMMTVNPYFGSDCLKPFIEACERYGKGIFILDKTSNPSAGELQDRLIEGGEPLYEMVARCIDRAGRDVMGERGYSSLGAVVGATYRESAERLRSLMPKTFFLVPGFGSQGGGPEDVVPCFNEDGYGALISSSRDVIFAYRREPYADQFDPEEFDLASRQAALDMRDDVLRAMERHGKIPPSW